MEAKFILTNMPIRQIKELKQGNATAGYFPPSLQALGMLLECYNPSWRYGDIKCIMSVEVYPVSTVSDAQ